MTQFIIGSKVAANAALTALRFQNDSMIGGLFLREDNARLSANHKLRHFTAEWWIYIRADNTCFLLLT
jgi:hypothetical protein